MNVILTQDVFKLGSLGDEVSVKSGYARNYLVPQGIAVAVTRQNIKMIEHQRALLAKKRQEAMDLAKTTADKMDTTDIIFKVKAGESGKLFGSVTQKMVADAVVEAGFDIDRRLIQLPVLIKSLGTVTVPVRLHTDVTATLTIKVVADEIIKEEKPVADVADVAASEEDEDESSED